MKGPGGSARSCWGWSVQELCSERSKVRGCWVVLYSLTFFRLSWDPCTMPAMSVQAGGVGHGWGSQESGGSQERWAERKLLRA